MSKYPIDSQSAAIVVDGREHNRKVPNVMFQRMPELSVTLAATAPGVYPTATIKFFGANSAGTLYNKAQAYGGVPKVLAICINRKQTVTMPAVVGATTAPFQASVFERCADDIISVNAGKATTAYLKNNTRSVGELFQTLEGFIPTIINAAYAEHPDMSVTDDRMLVSAVDGSISGSIDTPIVRRPVIMERLMRTVYPGTAAGGAVEPADGTPDGDMLVFPLTGDGIEGIGGAGFDADELFKSSEGVWQLTYKPADRLKLYHEVVPGTPDVTFSDITLEISVMYSVEVIDKSKLATGEAVVNYGEVWEINPTLKTFQAGGTTVFNSDEITDNQWLGWAIYRNDATLSGGEYFLHQIDAGPAVAYSPVIKLVPPVLNPALNFHTTNTFLKLDDGNDVEFPRANDQTARGVDFLTEFNDAQHAITALANYASRYLFLYELPMFADKGRRAATTSLMCGFATGTLKFGAQYGAAVVVPTLLARQHTSTIGLGGFCAPGYPIAWTNVHAAGIPGFGTRTKTDKLPSQFTPVNNWTLPVNQAGTALQVSMFRTLLPYAAYTAPDGSCKCGSGEGMLLHPVVPNPESSNAAMGKALSASYATNAANVAK